MARIKYSNYITRGRKPRRSPSLVEDIFLFFIGQGIVTIGELVKHAARMEDLSTLDVFDIVKKSIRDGILELVEMPEYFGHD